MVDHLGFDHDQSRRIIDLVENKIKNITKQLFDNVKRYKNKTVGSNIVFLLKHQHDIYDCIKYIRVNLFNLASTARIG